MLKAIIFDWGRTLYDSEQGALFPAVPTLLAELRGGIPWRSFRW